MQSPVFSSHWLSNPIFHKELQVSSRRRRSYVMRFVYIVSLGALLMTVWAEADGFGRGRNAITFVAEAGIALTASVVWFQFVACQLLAVIYLSSSISDEVYHRTLGVLMTTPLSSFHIVAGNLTSRLLQLMVVMAITLPILAVIRVFGGIPWDFIWRGSILTFCSTVFTGALSLLVSVHCRRSHTVIIITLLILGAWWVLVPLLAAIPGAVYGLYQDDPWVMVFSFIHPYFNLGIMTEGLFLARGTGWYGQWSWICDCLLMLLASLGMVSFAAYRVRAVGLSLMGGEAPVRKKSSKGKGTKIAKSIGKSRPLLGCPILWKELRTPLFGKRPILVKVLMCGAIGLMAILYLAMAHDNNFNDVDLQSFIILTLVGMPCLFAMIMSATTVTTEREARSWPVLLVTTIGHGQILRGKWLGIVRRVLPAWAFLVGHLVIFRAW